MTKSKPAQVKSAPVNSARANAKRAKAKPGVDSAVLPIKSAKPMLALLRGINVGGNKQVSMGQLRELAEALGLQAVQTYIQSGNLLFCTDVDAAEVEAQLEQAIARHFGFAVPVVCRTRKEWLSYAQGSPFKDAERERPNLLHLGLAKRAAATGAAAALHKYQTAGERVSVISDAIWLDYPSGVARSKVTPAVLDRAMGSSVTARNWRTVQTLAELLNKLAE